MAPNPRIVAISWLVRERKEYSEGDTFACQGCGGAFSPAVLELAHRVAARKNRSGRFQAKDFANDLLSMPVAKARKTARVLCANCHKVESAAQRLGGWK